MPIGANIRPTPATVEAAAPARSEGSVGLEPFARVIAGLADMGVTADGAAAPVSGEAPPGWLADEPAAALPVGDPSLDTPVPELPEGRSAPDQPLASVEDLLKLVSSGPTSAPPPGPVAGASEEEVPARRGESPQAEKPEPAALPTVAPVPSPPPSAIHAAPPPAPPAQVNAPRAAAALPVEQPALEEPPTVPETGLPRQMESVAPPEPRRFRLSPTALPIQPEAPARNTTKEAAAVPPPLGPIAATAPPVAALLENGLAAAPPIAQAPADIASSEAGETAIEHQLDLAHESEWLDRLAKDIARTAGGEGTSLRFRLNPEHLGSLHVQIMVDRTGTSVRLVADSEAARAIIADAQPRLAAEARAQGLRLSETHVDLASGQGGGGDASRGPETFFEPQVRTARVLQSSPEDARDDGKPTRKGSELYA